MEYLQSIAPMVISLKPCYYMCQSGSVPCAGAFCQSLGEGGFSQDRSIWGNLQGFIHNLTNDREITVAQVVMLSKTHLGTRTTADELIPRLMVVTIQIKFYKIVPVPASFTLVSLLLFPSPHKSPNITTKVLPLVLFLLQLDCIRFLSNTFV